MQITFHYGGSEIAQSPAPEIATRRDENVATTALGKRSLNRAQKASETNVEGESGGEDGRNGGGYCVRKRCFCGAAQCSGYLPSHT